MALKTYLEYETAYSIRCSRRMDHIGTISNVSKDWATKHFKEEGWIETDTEILCPYCAKEYI
jgi:hypothetical protein